MLASRTTNAVDASPVAETGGGHKPRILFGRFMLPDTSEHACQVSHLSPQGAVFLSSTVPPAGVAVVAYVDEIGRIEAVTGAPVDGGFEVAFQIAGARRDRIESRIRLLQNGDEAALEERQKPRGDSDKSSSHITLPDGRIYPCEVTDISLTGAAVKTDVMPALGTSILLGKMRGRIVRYLDTGVAVEFATRLEPAAAVARAR